MKAMEVPVYRPTLKEMEAGLEAYVHRIEREGGRFATAGLAKIIPPAGWTPRRAGYNNRWDVTIGRPIKQHATGTRGLYRTLLVEQKAMSARDDFQPLAEAEEAALPAAERLPTPTEAKADPTRYDEVLTARERRFWRSITMQPPLYGADVAGTLWDEPRGGSAASSSGGASNAASASPSSLLQNTTNPAVDRWNPGRLDSLLSRTLRKHDAEIPGVSTSYLYFGMWRSIFAWHTEDMDLASVNYLHFGAPKRWYCVPPAHRGRFERLARGLLPDLFRQCPEFLRHKELMISPQLLEAHAIPVVRCTQEPGEFMINFPGAYHAGFNHGWNCAESTNFATRAWVSVGARARACACSPDSVTIQMEFFLPHANPATKKVILDNLPSDSESESDEDGEEEEEEEEGSDDHDVSATPSAASGGVRSVSEASSRRHHHAAASSDDDDCCARSPVRSARGKPSKAALAAAAAAAAAANKKSRSGKRKPAAAKARASSAKAVANRTKAVGGVSKRVSPPAASQIKRRGAPASKQHRRVSPGAAASAGTSAATGFGFAAAAAKVANATAALLLPGFASLRANSRTRGAPPQTRAGRPVSAPRKLSL